MKIFHKVIAAICTVAMAASIAGCADVTKMGAIEGTEIKAGVYLWYVHDAMDNAEENVNAQLEALGTSSSKIDGFNYFDYKVEEKTFSDYVADSAMESIKRHIAVQKRFEEMNLTMTDEEKQEVRESAKDLWNTEITYYGYSTGVTYGESYERMGISRASYEEIQLIGKMNNKIFDAYYDENGITATDEKDIEVYFDDNYARFYIIQVALEEGDGSAIETDEGKAAMKKLAQGYLDRLLAGEDYDAVYHDYEEYVEEQKKLAEESKKEEDKTSSETTSSETTSSETTSSEETTSDETTSDDASSEEEEEEEHDHEFLLGVVDTQPSKEFIEWAFKLKEDEGGIFEGDKVYYVTVRKDLLEREDWYEKYRLDILHEMKDEEFAGILDEFAKDYDVQFSDAALDAYRADKVIR